ncbi:MAG TPA: response regulator, partial [Ktedonobacterales bacterium]|nr:response regulator [Ktedonobacterales bacterium]
VHGIESTEERAESGKAATGTVWVHAYYVGSEVIIEVGDDGRGVNPHKVTASAVAAGLLEGEAARVLSPAEALDLMFWPGVTTFDGAKAVSGRGIGLDEVRTAIQKLKGVISVRSELGKGSIFRVRVPISLSIVHALRVLAGDQSFAVPFTSVKRTLSLTASEILTSAPSTPGAPDGGADGHATGPFQRIRVERDGELPVAHGDGASQVNQAYDEIPVFALATLLGLEHVPRDPQPGLLVEVGRQRVALVVDGVFEEQEAAVQALPRPLQRRAVRGASVTPDGQVLLLLDLPELVAGTLDGSHTAPPPHPRPAPRFAETLAPRVLVVDDSVTIRQTLEHILQRGGFEVQQARDGIEALEMMLVSLPRVVVLDIEMPRLDGFEMLSILSGSPQFSDVPVVMLTSRAAEKHKEHALKLGARAYLIKPCPQEILLETVRSLLAEPVSGNP